MGSWRLQKLFYIDPVFFVLDINLSGNEKVFLVSPSQMIAFGQGQRTMFVQEMVKHLERCCSKQVEHLSEEEIESVVEAVIAKANLYHYVKRHDILCFMEIVFMCGSDFENDPKYDWLTQNLRRNSTHSSVDAQQLWRIANEQRMVGV